MTGSKLQTDYYEHPTLTRMKKENCWCVACKSKKPALLNGEARRWQTSTASYDEAITFSQNHHTKFPYCSVIINYGLVCVDLDSCLNKDTLSETAQQILNLFAGCYTEISSSGHGLHIFFYLCSSKKEIGSLTEKINQWKQRYTTKRSDLPGIGSLECYVEFQSRHIICTERNYPRQLAQTKTVITTDVFEQFLEQYMLKSMYRKNAHPSPSEKDYGNLKTILSETNGNIPLAEKVFRKRIEGKKREGKYITKWEREDYIGNALIKAKTDLEQELYWENIDAKGKTRALSNHMQYFSMGRGFFNALETDMPYFKKNKNLLYCFIKLLWHTSQQYVQGNTKTKRPRCTIHIAQLPQIFSCVSPESGGKKGIQKSLLILDELKNLGFVSFVSHKQEKTKSITVFINDFFDRGKMPNGNFEYHKNYIRVNRRIFKEFFEVHQQKAEKLDFLLFLCGNTVYLNKEEYRVWIRSYYFVQFGYWQKKDKSYITPRYEIREQDLAKALNITKGTISKYLTSLKELEYLYYTRNGRNIYERGIFISMCKIDSLNFRKVDYSEPDLIKKHHEDIQYCSKIRVESVQDYFPINAIDIWDLPVSSNQIYQQEEPDPQEIFTV